jgi:hypothetical protein
VTDELLQAALAGASRNGAEAPRAESPADALGEEMGLLLRAGLRDAYRRAGYVPSTAPEPFPPAPDIPETICPLVLEPALREMLERNAALPSAPREALHALRRRGWMLPRNVLVLALSSRIERGELVPVLGARGRWLAGLNPDWQRVLSGERPLNPQEIQRIWTEGAKGERAALIRRLREHDAAAARERVTAGFAAEPADLRQELVRALEVNLSSADEPFLEGALDDRSKGVRRVAAQLLACLPESAFVGRMVVRARELVARRRLRCDISLLPAPDPPDDWLRDGVGIGVPGATDRGLALTVQVLASMPAAVMARALDVSVEEVLAAADRYDATPLIDSWARNASPEERDALLPLLWDRWWAKPLQRSASEETLVLLARMMPAGVLRQRMVRLLGEPPSGAERFVVLVLNEMGEPWPADVSHAGLDLVRRWLARTLRRDRNAGDWVQIVRPLAAQTAPSTIGDALELLAAIERAKVLPIWTYEVRQAADTLRLRRRFWDAMTAAEMRGQ